MNKDKIINGIRIGEITLVAYLGDFPRESGNCFSMVTEKEPYKIVNFHAENLEELIERKVVSWPIKIIPISKTEAIVCDERIPDEWYKTEYCTICCPDDLLPPQQKAKHLRQEMRGERIEKNGLIIRKIKPTKDTLKAGFLVSSAIPLMTSQKPSIDQVAFTRFRKMALKPIEKETK